MKRASLPGQMLGQRQGVNKIIMEALSLILKGGRIIDPPRPFFVSLC
jgi:hypothetical protein